MLVPCFVCRRKIEHHSIGYVDKFPLCCYCYQTYKFVNLSGMRACQVCLRLFKPIDLVVSRHLVLCKACYQNIQGIADSIKRESVVYRNENDYWLEVKLWLMLLDTEADHGRENSVSANPGPLGSEKVAEGYSCAAG